MKKKILFVVLPYLIKQDKLSLKSILSIPYGVLSIASFIKDHAEVGIFDCNLFNNFEDVFLETAGCFYPDIIAISMQFENSYQYLPAIIKVIKAFDKKIEIVIGGETCNYYAEQILERHPEIDAVCLGEGELPVFDYITSGVLRKGWITRKNNCADKYIADDLSDFIDIDYSLIDIEKYQDSMEESYSPYMFGKEGKKQFMIVSSRGCIYSCKFCRNSTNQNKKIRYASVDSIIAHVEKLILEYGMNVLTFWDDQLLYDSDRAIELFNRLAVYKLRIEMPSGLSPNYIDSELLKSMDRAGVDTLYLAIESGSKEVLKIMNKPVSLDYVKELMPEIRDYGFFVMAFIVIGMPRETDKHRIETLDFLDKIKPDLISVRIASPVPGSKLRQECIEKGYIKDSKLGDFLMVDAVINTPDYSAEHLQSLCMVLNWEYNFKRNKSRQAGHYFKYVLDKYPDEEVAKLYLEKFQSRG